MEIDLHGMDQAQAKAALTTLLDTTEEKEIQVIHGYRSGTALCRFVRNEFHHKRLRKKWLTLNPGVTIFLLDDHLF